MMRIASPRYVMNADHVFPPYRPNTCQRDSPATRAGTSRRFGSSHKRCDSPIQRSGVALIENDIRDSMGDERYFIRNLTGPALREFLDHNTNASMAGRGPWPTGIRKAAFR
jgi:hypothetical protein